MLFETKLECLYLATYSPFGGVIRPAANVRLGLKYLEGTNTWAYASEEKKLYKIDTWSSCISQQHGKQLKRA